MSFELIKASILHGPGDLRTETFGIVPPASHELQVAIKATGICGSDQHYYKHYRNGDIQVREPMALGHESAGIVAEVGSDVTGFQVGDRVALEVGLPCGGCELCATGRYNLCKEMKFRGSAKSFPHSQGTLQGRINHPAQMCYKLPDEASLTEGALIEPLSVAIHAVRRAKLIPGANALILGAGSVGLLVAAMLRVEKVSNITIADIVEKRLDFATQNGFADRSVTLTPKKPEERALEDDMDIARETADQLVSPTGIQYDVVFECTGVEACVRAAIYSAAPGGRLMLIGMGTPVQTLPLLAASLREVDIIGCFRYVNTYQYAVDLLSRKEEIGIPDISKIVTQRFQGFEEAPSAFDTAASALDDEGNMVLKVMIET